MRGGGGSRGSDPLDLLRKKGNILIIFFYSMNSMSECMPGKHVEFQEGSEYDFGACLPPRHLIQVGRLGTPF